MDGFWGWALLMVFAIGLTASLLAAVVRVAILVERRVLARRVRSRKTAQVAAELPVRRSGGRNAPARESVRMSAEQARELDEKWTSLVDRLL
jgi:predicted cation transporter